MSLLGSGALCALSAAAPAQTVYHEVEPNNEKSTANAIGGADGMLPGDSVVGTTTGTETSGVESMDHFLIRTVAAPLGIYRYRLAVASSNSSGYIGAMLGVPVINCQPHPDTYSATLLHTSQQPIHAHWYGFGKQERVYWLVMGAPETPLPYTATVLREGVAPLDSAGPVAPGSIVIEAAPGNSTALEVVVYDAQLNPVPGYSNAGARRLVRTYAPGRYYVGVCPIDLTNSEPCPPDETIRSGVATDFPNWGLCRNTEFPLDLSLTITHGGGSVTVPITCTGAHDIEWLTLRVVAPFSCGTADFNGDGDFATDADIEAFFACLGGECCVSCFAGGADFNGDGDSATDADIEAFFRVLAGAPC